MDSAKPIDTLTDVRRWNDWLIEALWLLAVFAIPLVFSPPGWFAYFEVPKVAIARAAAAGIGIVWAFDLALTVWHRGLPYPPEMLREVRRWLRAQPVRWVVVAAVAYLGWVALSTMASAIPRIAMWGFEYGRDGQSLISVASVVTVFLAIALRLHRRSQVVRLLAAIVTVAILESAYALLQTLGVDPYDLSRLVPGRVIGTLLNPIFLASMLLQTVPLILVAAVLLWDRGPARAIPVAGAVAVGFVLLIIVLTAARGPWVGTAAGLVTLAALIGLLKDKHSAKRAGAVAGIAIVVLIVGVLATPTPEGGGALNATLDRLGTYEGAITGDVSGRTTIWGVAGELVAERPWFSFEDGAPSVWRHLFGYGPDSFLYVYPLASPSTSGAIELVKDGHNLWVHTAVETGVVGAGLLLAVYAIAAAAGAYGVVVRWRRWPMAWRLIGAALVASVVGRGVEQLVGVAQISDAMLSWTVLGLLVALPRVVEEQMPRRLERGRASVGARATSASVAAIAVILVGGFAVTHTWGNLFGARDAAASVNAERDEGDLLRAVELVNSAIEQAPASTAYRLRAASLFDQVRLTATEVDEVALIEGSLNVLRDGLEYNRVSLLLNARTGEALVNLVRRGRADLAQEAATYFERAAALYPRVREPQRVAGARLLELGMFERALPLIERALEVSTTANDQVDALALRAAGLTGAGRIDEAITTWRQALAVQPDGPNVEAIEANIEALAQQRAGG